MNKSTIFFDLDGTILDVSERIYNVYKKILEKYDKKFLSKKEYIKLKQEKKPVLEILKRTNAEGIIKQFGGEWIKNIEKEEFLALDKLQSLARKFLIKVSKKYKLVLVTLRHNSDNLKKELEDKKISNIFDKVLAKSGNGVKEKWKIKYNLIRKEKYLSGSVIVGDTETEIMAGKKLGLKTIAVMNGMRSGNYLKKYEPDCLVKKLWEIKI